MKKGSHKMSSLFRRAGRAGRKGGRLEGTVLASKKLLGPRDWGQGSFFFCFSFVLVVCPFSFARVALTLT